MRKLLVLGPGIRKKVLSRGDAKNFPGSLDEVKIQIKSRIFHNGSVVHYEDSKVINFQIGMSGPSVHVQLLGNIICLLLFWIVDVLRNVVDNESQSAQRCCLKVVLCRFH
jgi:hypothetical protein